MNGDGVVPKKRENHARPGIVVAPLRHVSNVRLQRMNWARRAWPRAPKCNLRIPVTAVQ